MPLVSLIAGEAELTLALLSRGTSIPGRSDLMTSYVEYTRRRTLSISASDISRALSVGSASGDFAGAHPPRQAKMAQASGSNR
jgi:hypothetical protein